MKIKKMLSYAFIIALAGLLLVLTAPASATPYLFPNPIDVDKRDRNSDGIWPDEGDKSCWLASAANMLGATGEYGNAEDIYTTLVDNFGYKKLASQYTALKWYTQNTKYVTPGDLYRNVMLYDYRDLECTPNLIASELRRGQFVGIGISPIPDPFSTPHTEGHALTAWGDDGNLPFPLLTVTDSDDYKREQQPGAGDTAEYQWTWKAEDAYFYLENYPWVSGPAPGYLWCVVTLCPVPEASTMVLFGSGLIGLLGFGRRRLFKRRNEA